LQGALKSLSIDVNARAAAHDPTGLSLMEYREIHIHKLVDVKDDVLLGLPFESLRKAKSESSPWPDEAA
jgi:hypothetical protein